MNHSETFLSRNSSIFWTTLMSFWKKSSQKWRLIRCNSSWTRCRQPLTLKSLALKQSNGWKILNCNRMNSWRNSQNLRRLSRTMTRLFVKRRIRSLLSRSKLTSLKDLTGSWKNWRLWFRRLRKRVRIQKHPYWLFHLRRKTWSERHLKRCKRNKTETLRT